MHKLGTVETGSVDLVYLDPPFFTQRTHSLKTRDGLKEFVFEDSWEDVGTYKQYIGERLNECKRVLKDTGSIFLHCDRTASHHLRVLLDEIFGTGNFQSEIVWAYKRWSNAKKGLLNAHQIIYFYSKSPRFKFNKIYGSYSPTTNIDQIFQKRMRNDAGRTTYRRDDDGAIELMDEKHGVPMSDVWEIPYLNPKAAERVGYPTQKPILLLERIIHLTTDKGDVVLDPFCGSGTTLVAAALLGRKYIGIDLSADAVSLAKQRLANPIKTESALLKKGKNSYLNQDQEILEILNEIDAMPVQRNKGIDGFLRIGNATRPVPIKIQRASESLRLAKELLLNASKKNGFNVAVLLKTNDFEDDTLFAHPEFDPKKLIVAQSSKQISQIKRQLEFA